MRELLEEREKGPIEILCKEIEFRFEPEMERPDLLISFVRVLVDAIGEMRSTTEAFAAKLQLPAPSDESAFALGLVRGMLRIDDPETMRRRCADVHEQLNQWLPEDGPTDHLVDMLSSCVSAVRFGLETPCRSRHAAKAADHIWQRRYGIGRLDQYTPAWRKDWTRQQLQKAMLSMIPAAQPSKTAAK